MLGGESSVHSLVWWSATSGPVYDGWVGEPLPAKCGRVLKSDWEKDGWVWFKSESLNFEETKMKEFCHFFPLSNVRSPFLAFVAWVCLPFSLSKWYQFSRHDHCGFYYLSFCQKIVCVGFIISQTNLPSVFFLIQLWNCLLFYSSLLILILFPLPPITNVNGSFRLRGKGKGYLGKKGEEEVTGKDKWVFSFFLSFLILR